MAKTQAGLGIAHGWETQLGNVLHYMCNLENYLNFMQEEL